MRYFLALVALGCTSLWATFAPMAHAQAAHALTVQSIHNWAQNEATQQHSSVIDARIEVQVGALDQRLTQAPCAQPTYATPSGARLWGRSAVMVRCPGDSAWSLRVPITVRVWGTALVATRTVLAFTPLRAEDLRPAEVELTREAQGVLTDLAQLEGRVATRMINAGQPVPLAALRAPQAVGQGDPVKVLGQGTGFAIATDAVALTSALEGQSVRVRLESGRVLTGIARAGRVVEVSF